jgi:hypothetical protein
MTLKEAIEFYEKEAEEKLYEFVDCVETHDTEAAEECAECGLKYRRLAAWLTELKELREINDTLIQLLLRCDLDVCCDDLMDNTEEEIICDERCNNKTKDCWIRWAKLKAKENRR